ncbi:MAG TPA: DNA-processing protein DprA [Solirubrobacteraceae bacterium]|jgi:DNA processing protein|nr:DNA-processing protein DprA [Solirubrobacteraceae bacterium]
MSGVCQECARRAWLLAKLGGRLDREIQRHDQSSFWSLLELPDLELIEAVARHRRAELHAAYAEWQPPPRCRDGQPQALCRHHAAYPRSLREDALSPHSFELRGGVERLRGLLEEKVVAIVGTRRASDYGMQVARELARGLAASGVTVASDFAEGIPSAALAGALEADGAPLAVMSAGVERCTPAWHAPLYRRVLESGCSMAESHASSRTRRWWAYASARTLGLLAQLVIVVEAADKPWDLACANVASSRARYVAAVPGRVSSPGSRGTNQLLVNGARLVRGPQDALDVLYGVGIYEASHQSLTALDLQPRLANVLELVGGGQDTLAKLAAGGIHSDEVAVALTELELRGLLSRGDGGRYVPCASVLTDERSRRISRREPSGRTI